MNHPTSTSEQTEQKTAKQRKAVALISGGLDSLLAAKVIQEQGIHVEGINFFTGFCVEGHTHAVRKKDKDKPKRNNALWVAEQLGMKLHIVDVVEPYKDVLLNPKHGYGQNMNPCLDCKGFMVKKAYEWMQEHGFDFIITGEVVGQRPMSQRKDTMPIVQKESGVGDYLLRPLSAKNLPETIPEIEGWVDREQLKDFSGRTRKPQMALAAHYGFKDYATPAGGCCTLTDENYSRKLVDMWKHRSSREYELDDIMLLKMGRHVRFDDKFKLIVGREEGENKFLSGYKNQFITLRTTSCPGPFVLLDGEMPEGEALDKALAVVARYSKDKNKESVTVTVRRPDGVEQDYTVKPMSLDEFQDSWLV